MYNEDLKIRLLHPALIVKNYVINENNQNGLKCDYEQYLREMINASDYFLKKSNYEHYIGPISEENGQSDCISKDYEMDFKLLASTTLVQGQREYSNQIMQLTPKISIGLPPRRNDGEINCILLHEALRLYDFKKLEEILHGSSKFRKGTPEFEVKNFLNKLLLKKNLFFLFPYEEDDDYLFDINNYADKMINALIENFKECIKFINKYRNQYDTYISFLYDLKLYILKVDHDDMKLIDIIDTKVSDTFVYLKFRYSHM